MSDHEQLWTAVAQLLRAQVSEAVWFSTFQDVVALASDSSMLRVSAPNAHARDRILSRYLPLVRDALEEIGASNLQFVIEVQLADTEPAPEWAPEPSVRDAPGQGSGPGDQQRGNQGGNQGGNQSENQSGKAWGHGGSRLGGQVWARASTTGMWTVLRATARDAIRCWW